MSHARVAIIADLVLVERTGRCHRAGNCRRTARGAGRFAGIPVVRHGCETIERSLAWLTAHRRLARNYERDPAVSEAFIRWATINTMIRRLDRGGHAKRQTRRLLNPPE